MSIIVSLLWWSFNINELYKKKISVWTRILQFLMTNCETFYSPRNKRMDSITRKMPIKCCLYVCPFFFYSALGLCLTGNNSFKYFAKYYIFLCMFPHGSRRLFLHCLLMCVWNWHLFYIPRNLAQNFLTNELI